MGRRYRCRGAASGAVSERLGPPALDAFEAAVADRPEVLSCHLMAGNFDYLLHMVVRDVGDYETVHRTHLAQLPGVDRMRSNFALRSVCDRTTYLIRDA